MHIVFHRSFLTFKSDNLISKTGCPTVCVTCKWAGVDSAWEPEKLEAGKRLVKRGDSHLSGARIVRKHALTEPASRRDKCLGARLETRRANRHCVNSFCHYDTRAGKIPQPFLTDSHCKELDDEAHLRTPYLALRADPTLKPNRYARNSAYDIA